MSSLLSTIEQLELVYDEEAKTISSDQLKAAFDYYAERFTPNTTVEIIHSLSKIPTLKSSGNSSYLTHPIISLVYGRLIESVKKALSGDDSLSIDEIVLMENCLHFLLKLVEAARQEGGALEDQLCRKILQVNESFLEFIQHDGWKTMENHEQTMNKVVELLARPEISVEDDLRLYDAFVRCVNSSDGIIDYLEAVKRLDTTLLSERDKFLLFTNFNYILENTRYTTEFQKEFVTLWVPKYEHMLKELLSVAAAAKEDEDLQLNAIKYLVTNLILMQRTIEPEENYSSRGQTNDFVLKDECSVIIKMLLPLLTNRHILKDLMEGESAELKVLYNNINSTTGVTATFVIWIVLKLILMFLNVNGDCLTYEKQDEKLKETLLELMKQINDDNPIKVSIYNILALLMSEQDIKNELSNAKAIIGTLITCIHDANEHPEGESARGGGNLSDLMVTLKETEHDILCTKIAYIYMRVYTKSGIF
ncbi:unnamed protein product [Didymodactylos carnosus]|uniref:Uncharacterized protein n=1 Tax=Didymodactylos carnosus TaxID=1234261 RepID=A0A815L1M5_9BILA|nr:unnamed protein product [Didymodactylos carnosus]CAF4294452.1 unnamed protein product [Didymodactylos carnosus]